MLWQLSCRCLEVFRAAFSRRNGYPSHGVSILSFLHLHTMCTIVKCAHTQNGRNIDHNKLSWNKTNRIPQASSPHFRHSLMPECHCAGKNETCKACIRQIEFSSSNIHAYMWGTSLTHKNLQIRGTSLTSFALTGYQTPARFHYCCHLFSVLECCGRTSSLLLWHYRNYFGGQILSMDWCSCLSTPPFGSFFLWTWRQKRTTVMPLQLQGTVFCSKMIIQNAFLVL